MSSTYYSVYPSAQFVDNTAAGRDRMKEPRNPPPHDNQQYIQPSTPVAAANHLSPSSAQVQSNSASPTLDNTHTPAESVLSVYYQSSEFSEVEDPFHGVNFDVDDFLQAALNEEQLNELVTQIALDSVQDVPQNAAYFPLSPDKTPSLHATPNGEAKRDRATFPSLSSNHAAPHKQLAALATQSAVLQDVPRSDYYTPETNGSGESSDDGLAPTTVVMSGQSPRVTVSLWGKDDVSVPYALETGQNQPGSFASFSADDTSYRYPDRPALSSSAPRDSSGRWVPDQATGQGGLGPDNRPSTEVPSINELDTDRNDKTRNNQVAEWLTRSETFPGVPITQSPEDDAGLPHQQRAAAPSDIDLKALKREEIECADTENKTISGQTYFTDTGGQFTETDFELMRGYRVWGDAPMPFSISRRGAKKYQPESSAMAMRKFEDMCRDNDSTVSRAATWGTRRRSLPSISDIEGITSGSFLKKLSLSRGVTRRPSLFSKVQGIVRKPSNSFKRGRGGDTDDDSSGVTETSADRRESQASLAPPSRSLSWKKEKQPVPSINTAFVAMGSSVAAIGTSHARSSSISATPITSPKSPNSFALSVRKPLNRIRSKSDISKAPVSGIADMWKKSGGPPVASLAKATLHQPEADDDDEDDDDMYEDAEMKAEADQIMDDITPDPAGFKQHVLKLNPQLAVKGNYLVERIAYQQQVRYKALLHAKKQHLGYVDAKNCPSGQMCVALGGQAVVLDSKGESIDPRSRGDGSDGDMTPIEGAISQESFPADIPMPPTMSLPSEFECQLCFQPKKFQKPSDWTKHVHEDIQPFTCTWPGCRDPKIFKRKADWVRHENEGHRHLEWWKCDVDDCTHVCYRRDNFLQHLVREHKFPEPRVKTKAAIKRAGGQDPTWAKVEHCHHETTKLPQQEACVFCGKTFPSWKKLTVHLAKHMEQISLPILKLVERKKLESDTLISPVQEPPQRPFPIPSKRESQPYDRSPGTVSQPQMSFSPGNPQHYPTTSQQQQQAYMYPIVPTGYQNPLYPSYDNLGQQNMALSAQMSLQPANFTSLSPQSYTGVASLPVTTTGGYIDMAAVSNQQYMPVPSQPLALQTMASDIEPFPALSMNPLGLQGATQLPFGGVNVMDPHHAAEQQYPAQQGHPQGSVSPYSHSPHQGHAGFYPHP